MPTFSYKAYTPEGVSITGRRDAADIQELRAHLSAAGVLYVNDTIREHRPLWGDPRRIKLSVNEQCELFEQYERHLANNVHAVEAAAIIGEAGSTRKIRVLMRELHASIARGQLSLTEGFRLFPRSFSESMVTIIKAGEDAGALPERFKDLRELRQAFRDLRSSFLQGAIHPTMVAAGMIALLNFLFGNVLPVIGGVLKENGYRFAPPAERLYQFSIWLGGHQDVVFWTGAVFFFALWMLFHAPPQSKAALLRDKAILKIPLWGSAVRSAATVIIFRVYAGLYEAGKMPPENLETCAKLSKNVAVQAALKQITADVKAGKSLSAAFTATKVFPLDACALIRAGENGALGNCMRSAAEYHSILVVRRLSAVLKIGQPVTLVVLGVCLTLLVVWYVLPLLNIGSSLVHNAY